MLLVFGQKAKIICGCDQKANIVEYIKISYFGRILVKCEKLCKKPICQTIRKTSNNYKNIQMKPKTARF